MDFAIFQFLNSFVFENEWLDAWIVFGAEFLGWWILGVLAVIIIFSKERRRWLKVGGYAVFTGIVSRFIFTEIIRFFYDRPRPFETAEGVRQLIFHSPGGSFPSGHAAFFFAAAAAIFFYRRGWGALFLAMALLMSMARVAAGVHWPSDILGGAAVGIATAWLARRLFSRLRPLANGPEK